MRVRLIERCHPPQHAREIVVSQDDFLIGRGADCDLILHESTISRHHCIIRAGANEPALVDLGSINGTYLSGQRVRSTAPLHSGDELVLGTNRFVVVLGDEDWVDPGAHTQDSPMAHTLKVRDLPKR